MDAPVRIRASELGVRYGARRALDGLSFEARAGEVVGLLGPNGAGKTTTLSVLATLRAPDAGEAEVAGHSTVRAPAAVRHALGFVPQSLAVYPSLTARENLRLFAGLFGLRSRAAREAAARALATVGLEDRADDLVATFSGGMQRRLNLACGLLHGPAVLLLDEPTVGVDPQSRERIFSSVRAHAAEGAAVLYSTHYMEEAERLCDRVVLIDHGSVVATGKPADLVAGAGGSMRLELTTRAPLPDGWLGDLAHAQVEIVEIVEIAETSGEPQVTRIALADLASAARVLERASSCAEVLDFRLRQPNLQEVFLKLTGHGLRD